MLQGLQPARKPIPGGMLWKQEKKQQMLERAKLNKLNKLSQDNIALPYKKGNVEGNSQQPSTDNPQE